MAQPLRHSESTQELRHWDHAADNEETRRIIVDQNTYVDDLLMGTPTTHDAICNATGVRDALKKEDFHLRGWTSNSPEFLAALNPQAPAVAEVDLGSGETNVLGVDHLPGRLWEGRRACGDSWEFLGNVVLWGKS